MPEKEAQYQKERREYLKAHGICVNCGCRDAIAGRIYCQDCRDKHNLARRGKKNKPLTDEKKQAQYNRKKAIYEDRKQKGLCTYCGKKPALPGILKCKDCRTYFNQYKSGYFQHTAKYIKKEIEQGRLKA